ncbi:MAG TPA: DUF222 domain-containing protein [Acidimicrobiia bacterium]|nr:DUF222 domain-containing protein [Acidimicrobiia bacterium]
MFDHEKSAHRTTAFPVGLLDREPGPELAAFLSVVDPAELSGHDQVLVLQAHQKMASHYAARVYQNIAELADVMVEFDGDVEFGLDAAAMELRAALRLTRRMAEVEIDFAHVLKHRLPAVGQALWSGEIDVRRARVLVNGTEHLSDSHARQVIDEVIGRAPQLTTGELRSKVQKLCLEIEPEAAKKRYESALEEHRLVREPTVDGTANIILSDISSVRASAAFDHINSLAESLRVPGETRTMDQLRADIALDLICGDSAHQTKRNGTVNIHVDLETLAGLADRPGELAGFGPVIADIARQVADERKESNWRYRVTDPDTGMPVHIGTTRRRPDARQQRHVELRDLTCVFPGCRMPATDCDLDHIKPWAETGKTNVKDLAPGCRHDHVGRHQFDWKYQPLPGGDYLWISPLGHRYTKSGRPPPKEC